MATGYPANPSVQESACVFFEGGEHGQAFDDHVVQVIPEIRFSLRDSERFSSAWTM
jgi:hypothetical protein